MMFESTKLALNKFLHDLNGKDKLLEIDEEDIDIIKDYIFTRDIDILRYDKDNLIKKGDLIGFDDNQNMVVLVSRLTRMKDGKKRTSSKLLYLKDKLVLYKSSGPTGTVSENKLNYYISQKLNKYFEGDRVYKIMRNEKETNSDKDIEFVIARNLAEAQRRATIPYKKVDELSKEEYTTEISASIEKLEKQKQEIQNKIDRFKSFEEDMT